MKQMGPYYYFFFYDIFLMWTILTVILNLLQRCFCFCFDFFGNEACGILTLQPGVKPAPGWKAVS